MLRLDRGGWRRNRRQSLHVIGSQIRYRPGEEACEYLIMPRGGRRGRFLQRFHREGEEGVPPPPPPPNVEHVWTLPSPARRSGRRRHPWHVDPHSQENSPPPRWGGPVRDNYIDFDDDQIEHVNRNPSLNEICFICGDLLSNHPEVPTIHLCDNGDFAVVASGGIGNREGNLSQDGTSIASSSVSRSRGGDSGGTNTVLEDKDVEDLNQRLHDTQQSLEGMTIKIKELCSRLQTRDQQAAKDEEAEPKENFTENLMGVLQNELQEQYQSFISKVRHEIKQKSTSLDHESRRVKKDKDDISKTLEDLEARTQQLDLREKELEELRKKVETDRTKFMKDSDQEKTEIRRQWQKLNDEIKRMEELHKLQKSRVKLDVGGHLFTTSTTTLTRDPDSMLTAMFSGRHIIKFEDDGSVFIDRDGTHFRYILNYLRDGVTEGSLPEDQQTLKELLNETIYYQITGLVEAIEDKIQ